MRPLIELVDLCDSAWPLIEAWISSAAVGVESLPASSDVAGRELHAVQVTTRSPMGALVFNSAGLLIDSGWLRILGSGSHPRFQRSLASWNAGRNEGFYLIADDVVGGFFALNGGSLGDDRGQVYYFAPDSLRWEPCHFGYSDFLSWSMSDRLELFYRNLRWPDWQRDVATVPADQSLSIYPFLFLDGPALKDRSRRAIPVAEQYGLQCDLQRQLDGKS
jgi:hypothetical protein